jgi:pyocin large subunit-like protein
MGGGISGLFSGTQGGGKTGKAGATGFFPGKLEEHYEDDEDDDDDFDVPFKVPLTIEEYEARAKKFFAQELTDTTAYFYDVDNVLYRYDKKTNEFGMCRADGIIITYFLPKDKLNYWYRKVQENAV